MAADLHLHSNYSDGNWTVVDIINYALNKRISHIAICDHDTISGLHDAITYANSKLKIIPAVEISSRHNLPVNATLDLHILGYFIDCNNENLLNVLANQRLARYNQSKSILNNIQANHSDININIDTLTNLKLGYSIGTAHLTKAILKLRPELNLTAIWNEFISNNSNYFVQRQMLSTLEAIQIINEANGIAILAHPGHLGKTLKDILPILIKHGLAGIEVFHPSHNQYLSNYYLKLAYEYNLLVTGGSDCHGPYAEFPPSLGNILLNDNYFHKMLNQKF